VFTAVRIARHSLTHICFTVLRIIIPVSYLFRLVKEPLEITENLQERRHLIPDGAAVSKVYCTYIIFTQTTRVTDMQGVI
jgi:hypothetical protein